MPQKIVKKIVFALILISGISCSHGSKQHWSYEGHESPDHWAELSTDYKRCQSGHHQSPIDLHTKDNPIGKQKLETFYHPTHTHIVNNGHTIEFDMDQKNIIKIDGKEFELIQLHFHADSEHTVDSNHFPAEMHLVHKAKDGKLAVLGLLIDVGQSKTFDHIFDKIPNIGEEVKVDLHLEKFLPENRARFTYEGSLTTPPCTEGVKWIIFEKHIRVPQAQLMKFRSYYSHNFRPTQKTYDRQVQYIKK